MIAFGYYGGKYIHLDWLLPLLECPTSDKPHQTYVEPFCGSMVVALNRKHGKHRRIIVNDKDGAVVNFFKCLRDNEDELIRLISLSPCAEKEWADGRAHCRSAELLRDNPLEAARLFFTFISQNYSRIPTSGSRSFWGHSYSRTREKIQARLGGMADRLQNFQFHCADAMRIIKRHTRPDVLMYLDPPYTHDSRVDLNAYEHDDFDDKHEEMLDILAADDNPANIAISGYHNDLYDSKLKGWHVHERKTYSSASRVKDNASPKRIEVLWTNYKPVRRQEASIW